MENLAEALSSSLWHHDVPPQCLMGLKSFCCRRRWQGLSLCETSAHVVISEIAATAQNWMKLFSMFESCVELCAHSFTAQT